MNDTKILNEDAVDVVIKLSTVSGNKIADFPDIIPSDVFECIYFSDTVPIGASFDNYKDGFCECTLAIKKTMVEQFKKAIKDRGITVVGDEMPHYDWRRE